MVRFFLLLASLTTIAHASDSKPDFAREVLPILSERCYVCHGPDADEDELRLDSFEAATADLGGYKAIDVEVPEDSELIYRIYDEDDPMPPADAESQMTAEERDIIKRWIESGAEYAKHWSFVAPEKPQSGDHIDHFVEKSLENEGHTLAAPTDAATLARRAALVLTGLPPEREQLDRYLADPGPQAYETLVDELLASSRFGEHHARYWLDAVRYGDTHGLHLDNRRGIYPYRDWVVKAFNDNLPFDDFITWQLAGDLLPDPTLEQLTATGYVRMNPTTAEGGVIPAEFQAKNNFDRTENLGTVFLGMTLNCARCHTHKYDPITHQEYFELFAFFNSTAESPLDGNAYLYPPTLEVPSTQKGWREWPDLKSRQDQLLGQIDQLFASDPSLQTKALDYAQQTLDWGMSNWRVTKDLPIDKESPDAKDWKEIAGAGDIGKERFGNHQMAKWVTFDLRLKRPQTLVYKNNTGERSTLRATRPKPRPARQTPKLVHHFPLADVASGQLKNAITGQALLLTKGQNTPTERGLKLDGKTQYSGSDEHMPRLKADEPFSFSLWVKAPANARGAVLSRLNTPKSFRGIDIWSEGTSIGTHMIDTWPSNAMKVMSKGGLKPDAWNHVVLTYDGSHSANGVRIYINGSSMETYAYVDKLTGSIATDVTFKLGSRTDSDYWAGEVDDIRVYTSTLSATDVARVAKGEAPLEAPKPQTIEQPDDNQPYPELHLTKGYTTLARESGTHTITAKLQGVDGRMRARVEILNPWETYARTKDWSKASEIDRITMAGDPLSSVFPAEIQKQAQALTDQLINARAEFTTTLIAKDLPAPRETKILDRGEYSTPKGDPLQPGTFSVLNSYPEDAPRNRLGLAQWLLADDQPLVGRVLVNRIWQTIFGEGIVRSPEDFGLQGRHPTHPELLDWLAVSWREGGWNYKDLVKQMVLSQTFQQNSARRSDLPPDPDNLLLARGPSYRLDAEVIRDTGLWASGLLLDDMGGEGVKPWQPEGMWAALSHPASNTKLYEPDTDQRVQRRSLYVYWKRTSPHPMMTLFDAPSREVSCVRRSRGNTPLQSLGLLNEPQRLEMARGLAQRLVRAEKTDVARLDRLFIALTCQPPNEVESQACLTLLEQASARYSENQADAASLTQQANATAELAAWTQVVNTLLASDASILLY